MSLKHRLKKLELETPSEGLSVMIFRWNDDGEVNKVICPVGAPILRSHRETEEEFIDRAYEESRAFATAAKYPTKLLTLFAERGRA